jgi:hypothetical protein
MAHFLDKRPVLKALLATKGFQTAGKPIKYMSPSHFAKYGMCPRRWYAHYILGIKEEMGPAAALGSEVHEVIEQYLRGEITELPDTEAGRVALAGSDYWPDVGRVKAGRVLIEKELLIDSKNIPGLLYYGLADWIDLDAPEVGDHKTSSDPDKWGLNAEQLHEDFQMADYVLGTLGLGVQPKMNMAGQPAVYVKHVQYRTRKPYKAAPIRALVSVQQAKNVLDEMDEQAQTMLEVGKIPDFKATPYKTSGCSKYGKAGCYLREACASLGVQAYDDDVLNGYAKQKGDYMGVLDRLMKGATKAAAEATAEGIDVPGSADINPPDGYPPQEAVPPAAVRSEPSSSFAAEEGERLAAERLAAKSAEKAEREAVKEAEKVEKATRKSSSVKLPGRKDTAPADAPAAEEPKVAREHILSAVTGLRASDQEWAALQVDTSALDKATADLKRLEDKLERAAAQLDDADEDEKDTYSAMVDACQTKVTTQRQVVADTREALSKACDLQLEAMRAAARKEMEAKVTVKAETPAPSTTSVTVANNAPPSTSGMTLYLGCGPRRAASMDFDLFIMPVAGALEAASKVPHWRLLGHDAQAKLMAELLRQISSGEVRLPEHLCIRLVSAHYHVIIETLSQMASEVVGS